MSNTVTDAASDLATPTYPSTAVRLAPLSGIAAVAFFIGGVVASSPPDSKASDAQWLANYTASHDGGHIASGVCLVLTGLSFLVFAVAFWRRIDAACSDGRGPSPLPAIAGGVSAACIGVGGVLMAGPSAVVSGGGPVPSADLLRFSNSVGFTMVAVPGMLAAALTVVALTIQGHRAAVIGSKLYVFGIVVSVALLGSLQFIPIALLLVWLIVVAVAQLRGSTAAHSAT